MSTSNGVCVTRIARKGTQQFAFGKDGEPFEVDVVDTWYEWMAIDEELRGEPGPSEVVGEIRDWKEYNQATVDFCRKLNGDKDPEDGPITKTEAREFIRLLRERYDECADFFRYRSREERGSPASSEAGSPSTLATRQVFSEEES